ncbi:MAG: copper-binding protein [Alphaproteobacteria bacterium GM202ARS2]|nr:copper-binding protein [Alphaproteobacteria bacterium GM202ARS2]
MPFVFVVLLLLPLLLVPHPAISEGDLAIKAENITLHLGSADSDYHTEPKTMNLTTGQAYRLEIIAHGYKSYTWQAEEFLENVWLRSIEAEGVEIEAPTIYEIEFDDANEPIEIEITFVPIRPGTYPFSVKGLESRGMQGQFIVR